MSTLSDQIAMLQGQLQSMAQQAAYLKTQRDALLAQRALVQQQITDLQAFVSANPQYGSMGT
jgi:hypothetical protein